MPETKKPEDHKKSKAELEFFAFEYDGETYTFEKSLSALSKPGFIRKNRHKDEMDILFTIFETIAGDEALAVIDDMEQDEFEKFAGEFSEAVEAYQGASLGE
jgi:hypothetical protein